MIFPAAKTKIFGEHETSLVIGWARRFQQWGTIEIFPQRFHLHFRALAVGVV
jgi:hypothetical protein